jgi:nucleotide-binding universal stress UspA family protein
MFQSILVPTDGTPVSERAIQAAIDMAQASGGRIYGLCVAEPYPFSPMAEGALVADSAEFEDRMRQMAQENVEKVRQAAQQKGVPCEVEVATSYSPYDEIVKSAQAHHCDLIVMATHGRHGLNRLLLGSQTQKVLNHTDIPVLILH